MKWIAVFCGSKVGDTAVYRNAAVDLGRLMVHSGYGLVFGGGGIGLMGVIADSVLDAGGDVIGVLPNKLATNELRHERVADMRIVNNMHERKSLMSELSDAFVALPGGLGTFEEFFEVVTWAQLGFHQKNIGLLNVAGYFDPLIRLIDHAIQEGFIKSEHRELIVIQENSQALLRQLVEHQLPAVRRWRGPNI